jgi:hypothetical protein
LAGFESRVLHVCIPHTSRTPSLAGVRYHRSRNFESLVAPLRLPRRIALPHALIAMASSGGSDERAHHVLAAAVQQRLVRTSDLRQAATAQPKLRRRQAISESLLDIDDGAQSLNEIAMKRIVRSYGLPTPQLQIHSATARRRSRIDGGWPDDGVYFEIDGTGHFEIAKWLDDADRHNEIALARRGSVLLRWPGFVVRRRPELVATQARLALGLRVTA